jgi:hypothetical protein
MMGVHSEHTYDQWPLHEEWEFKDQLFGGTVVNVNQETIPQIFSIRDPYPNPFNPIVNIIFTLNHGTKVTAEIIDMNGKIVDTLINHNLMQGKHKISWVSDSHSSGIYFIRITTPDLIETKKLLLLK